MDTVNTKKSADLSTLKVFVMSIWKAGVRARVAQTDTAKPAYGQFSHDTLASDDQKGMHTKTSAKLSDV